MPTRNGTYGVTDDICEERRCGLYKAIEIAVSHERELRESSFLVRDEALRAQAIEYERRLEVLNRSHDRADRVGETFFKVKDHEAFAGEYRRFRDEVRQHQTTVATWGAAAIFVLGLLQFAVHFWLK